MLAVMGGGGGCDWINGSRVELELDGTEEDFDPFATAAANGSKPRPTTLFAVWCVGTAILDWWVPCELGWYDIRSLVLVVDTGIAGVVGGTGRGAAVMLLLLVGVGVGESREGGGRFASTAAMNCMTWSIVGRPAGWVRSMARTRLSVLLEWWLAGMS